MGKKVIDLNEMIKKEMVVASKVQDLFFIQHLKEAFITWSEIVTVFNDVFKKIAETLIKKIVRPVKDNDVIIKSKPRVSNNIPRINFNSAVMRDQVIDKRPRNLIKKII